MTLLVPILFAGFILGAITLMLKNIERSNVLVIDESETVFVDELKSTNEVHFTFTHLPIAKAKKEFYSSPFDVILYLPFELGEHDLLKSYKAQIFFKKQPGILLEETIKKQLENILYNYQLFQFGIDKNKVEEAQRFHIGLDLTQLDENGNEKLRNTNVTWGIGFASGILVFIFVLLYGIQVMRGVIEEKSNRIVEVIISSVKPFQLMMGKIIGVAMVGLTQFLMWIVLSAIFISVGQATFLKKYSEEMIPLMQKKIPEYKSPKNAIQFQNNISTKDINEDVAQLLDALSDKKFIFTLLSCFLFYFLGGYLLYSALFAALGAAVDSETETQQFMMPVMIPLMLGYIVSILMMENPQSSIAFWFSIIPFTSPIVMMTRLPFGVPAWELFLSMALLVATFVFMTWLAGKIYRTGILMYGKKVSYKELWKWLRYSG